MNIENHKKGKISLDSSILLLFKSDPIKHEKLIVEGCVLAAANLANMFFHLRKITEHNDIKHNNIEGFILEKNVFMENSFEFSRMFRNMEDFKYKVVHGSSATKKDVENALKLYKEIQKKLLELEPKLKEILGDKNETID